MFRNATSFNGDVSRWDVSNVTTMYAMFYGASSFNGEVSQWVVSNVTSMWAMFENAISFNGDVSGWNVSNVRYMESMFRDATSFIGDVSGWNIHPNCDTTSYLDNTLIDYYIKRKEATLEATNIIKEELLAAAWEPSRMEEWCLDLDERYEVDELF